MVISDLAKRLECDIVAGNQKDNDNNLENVYIGDLLSVVMSKAKEQAIWITIQTHLNVMAVAELLDLACVIIVEGMDIEEDTIGKANELSIPILKSNKSAYEIACLINSIK